MNIKDAQSILDEITRLNYTPKGADKDLIESVKRCISWNKNLSQGQSKWILDIYQRASGGGIYQQKQRL
jgi:hypothetical protein